MKIVNIFENIKSNKDEPKIDNARGQEITCWNCGHKFGVIISGSYPNGPCPHICPSCDEICCPECGGELVPTGRETFDDNTYGGCCECDWECCGACV